MNPLKKGPELKLPDKMPELKVPKLLADIYADLRDRHLLPLVAVLVIAIVAIPIALSESGGEEEEPVGVAPTPAAGASSAASGAKHIVVAQSTPGLRSYHDRLRHRSPSNPFKPQFTGAPKQEESGEEGGGGGEGPESGAPPSSEGGEVTVTAEGGKTVTETHELKYFTYEIDVRVVPVSSSGHPSDAKPSVRHGLPELTPIPGRKTPALVFMQPSADEEKALMLVNPNVKGLFGEAVCVSGGETCQLLQLEKGMPETVVYGGKERVFKIELLKISIVGTAPPKAKPDNSKHAG